MRLFNQPVNFLKVGNIPYGVSEEQLKDIFSEVGQVVSFRYFLDWFGLVSMWLLKLLCGKLQDRARSRDWSFEGFWFLRIC